ncbi:Protein of unknown function [Dyella marensis]|uniref:DUF3540 domain-containing protein n=2 Tax=Rhodanobacteraceae TaxID=1775411 RepID=A0A1I1XCL5_9GAMM|nr:Protein of unknown function [Dyella marensis]
MFAARQAKTMQAKTAPLAAPAWFEATIRDSAGRDAWRLDDGRSARQAVSCLVTPQPGDRVLLVATADGECFVLHVLARADGGRATLAVPGADAVSIRQAEVDIAATRSIALRAGEGVEVTAVQGTLSLNARQLFASAAESLVHTARTYVGQVDQFLLDARQFLRLHGEQALITARQDAKIDAERISLG